jgi:hypothetical protein
MVDYPVCDLERIEDIGDEVLIQPRLSRSFEHGGRRRRFFSAR